MEARRANDTHFAGLHPQIQAAVLLVEQFSETMHEYGEFMGHPHRSVSPECAHLTCFDPACAPSQLAQSPPTPQRPPEGPPSPNLVPTPSLGRKQALEPPVLLFPPGAAPAAACTPVSPKMAPVYQSLLGPKPCQPTPQAGIPCARRWSTASHLLHPACRSSSWLHVPAPPSRPCHCMPLCCPPLRPCRALTVRWPWQQAEAVTDVDRVLWHLHTRRVSSQWRRPL